MKRDHGFYVQGKPQFRLKAKHLRKRVNHCLRLLFILVVDGKASKRYLRVLSFYVVYLELPCNKI